RLQHGDLRPAVLAPAVLHHAAFELRHELHAVTHAQDGDPEAEELGAGGGDVIAVDRCGTAGEHDAGRLPRADPVERDGRRVDLAVDALPADAARDELREL